MNKKKVAILLLGDCFYDARTLNMCFSLSKSFSVTVVSTFDTVIHNNKLKNIVFCKINILKPGILRYFEYHFKVSRFLKKNSFDYIVSGDLYSLSSSCLHKKKGEVIYDCREIYSNLSEHINKPLHRFLCNFYESFFIKFVSSVLVTAKTDLTFLKKKYANLSFLNWFVIYNYPSNFLLGEDFDLRKKYSISKKDKLVLYQGMLHKGRGIEKLIKLTSLTKNITSVILGDGIEKQRYISLAKKLKVEHRVLFISKVPYFELINYTKCCDLGWCVVDNKSLSHKYALPNKLFEYLLGGIPVLASPLINIKKIVLKHKVGLCVDADDTNMQIKALNSLLSNQQSSFYYKKIALRLFTWDSQKNVFLKVFK